MSQRPKAPQLTPQIQRAMMNAAAQEQHQMRMQQAAYLEQKIRTGDQAVQMLTALAKKGELRFSSLVQDQPEPGDGIKKTLDEKTNEYVITYISAADAEAERKKLLVELEAEQQRLRAEAAPATGGPSLRVIEKDEEPPSSSIIEIARS